MTHKNPYETRAAMAQLAKDYPDTQQELNHQFPHDRHEHGTKNMLQVQVAYKTAIMDDMMPKATAMNSFVSTPPKQHDT